MTGTSSTSSAGIGNPPSSGGQSSGSPRPGVAGASGGAGTSSGGTSSAGTTTAGGSGRSGGTGGATPEAGAATAGAPLVETDASIPLPEPDLSTFRLVVIGSSTSAGEGASRRERGWVSLLDDALSDAITSGFSTRNLSVGGYSSASLLAGSGNDGNIDDALEEQPNLVLVALAGSNDLSAGVHQDTFMQRLESIRDAGEAAGTPVFFVSTAPKDLSSSEREALRDWTGEMAERFEPCAIPDLGSDYSPCFIDVFGALANGSLGIASEFGSGDGIHLNDAGHAEIFRVAHAIVLPYVCSRIACQ